ncbi:MAG: HEAT repeat domain-containing protein [Myxococcota bacterium]
MIPPLAPTFDAALRDVSANGARFRIAAANRLGAAPEERRGEAVAGLRTLMGDPVGPVREAAFEAAGELGAPETLAQLLLGFDDEDRGARQSAVLAAGRVAPEQATPSIEQLLEDNRPEMRFSAVWTLSKIGAVTPETLVARLDDGDDEVRMVALECLATADARAHTDHVARLLEDPASGIPLAAASTLAALGDSRGAGTLRRALSEDAHAFDAAIALGDLRDQESLGALTAMARKRFGSPILRAAAARALVRLGQPEGTAIIRKILRSWRIEARQYAAELVGELELVELLPDLERAWRRSRGSAQPAYEASLERLASKSSEARALLASVRATDHPT